MSDGLRQRPVLSANKDGRSSAQMHGFFPRMTQMNAANRPSVATDTPLLVVADADGRLFEVPELHALGRSGGSVVDVPGNLYSKLPDGSLLFHLPGRHPVGRDPESGEIVVLESYAGQKVFAACAFLPPAHTALYLAPWEREEHAKPLPLYAYCALGFDQRGFLVPAVRVDADIRQDLTHFDQDEIKRCAYRKKERYPENPLVEHLVDHCALEYCCPAAQNFVLGRWEAPIPTSPHCNAECIGCISSQPNEEVPVTQPRLDFVPSAEQIADMAADHLREAPRPVVSFGQGCEGEPLLRGEHLAEAIRLIRSRTERGTIHLNSNASRPAVIEKMVAAGLNSLRISLNSAQPELYARYYRPRGYDLEQVVESGRIVSRSGGLVSLNYFIFPGVTDTEEEYGALRSLLDRTGAQVIQMRNLNIDPDSYLEGLGLERSTQPGFGIDLWMERIRRDRPEIRFAYFNPPREDWPAPSANRR